MGCSRAESAKGRFVKLEPCEYIRCYEHHLIFSSKLKVTFELPKHFHINHKEKWHLNSLIVTLKKLY